MKRIKESFHKSALGECGKVQGARLLGWSIFYTLIFIIGASFFVPWTQTIYGRGHLTAFSPVDRATPIKAPISGRIKKWFVQEGDKVQKGEPIAELVDNDPLILERLGRTLEAAKSEAEAIKAAVKIAEQQIEAMISARDAALENSKLNVEINREVLNEKKQKLIAAEAKMETADLNYKRQSTLHKNELVSDRSYELAELSDKTAESEYQQALATVRAAENKVSASEEKLKEIAQSYKAKVDKTKAEFEKLKASLSKAQAKLAESETKLSRQRQMVIKAPFNARVLSIQAGQEIEYLKEGQEIGTLVPDTEARAVQVYVDGNDAPLISEGSHVRLQFEGWPAVQFVGWPSAAVGTFGGKVAFMDYAAREDGNFRVMIIPDDDDLPWPESDFLRQGAQAKAWILLNDVSIAYEIWRQINGFPPTNLTIPERVKVKVKK